MNSNPMEKTWSVNTKDGLSIAYFKFVIFMVKVFLVSFILYKIADASGWSIYWMYLFVVIMLLYSVSRLRQFAAYNFAIDNTTNTLHISGVNMLRQQKHEVLQLAGIESEFLKALRWNGITDEVFTLTLMKGDKVIIKIMEGYYDWTEEKLREIHDYFQGLKQ